jgi:hypothetical protein
MDIEGLIIIWVFGLAFLPLVARLRKSSSRSTGHAALALWVGAAAGVGLFAINQRPEVIPETSIKDRPILQNAEGYASSQTCRSCHPAEYHSWHGSYHRTMTQLATPQSVLGDFNNASVTYLGKTFNLSQKGGEFWVEMDDPKHDNQFLDAPRITRQLVMTTGSHHSQLYWYPSGQTRKLTPLPIVWIKEIERWIPKASMVLVPPVRQFHDETGRWNRQCIRCHTTGEQPQLYTDRKMDSRVTEFGIACEACHGPAEEHVQFHRNPTTRYALHLNDAPDQSIVDPMRLTSERSSQVCAQCHVVWKHATDQDSADWLLNGKNYKPGDDLADTLTTVRYGDAASDNERDNLKGLFWSDGMIRVTARESNGLIESPCYKHALKDQKLSCMSCHGMHSPAKDKESLKAWADDQLKPGMRTNQACLQCHDEMKDRLTEHTHHSPESTGSLCYNCHMSYTAYGLHKAVRSHEIDSPSTLTSLQTGRPNACNQCHLDQTLEWTALNLSEWYDIPSPKLPDDDRRIAASIRWLLEGDAGQRALIAWSMGWEPALETSGSDWMAPYLAQLLVDPYDAVRYIALRSIKRQPGFENFNYDYLASDDDLHEGMLRAREIWRKTSQTPAKTNLLIIAQGALEQASFERLLKNRNDSPVYLQE